LKPVTPFQHTMNGLSLFALLLEVNGVHNVMHKGDSGLGEYSSW
jgi:hypothetical protein